MRENGFPLTRIPPYSPFFYAVLKTITLVDLLSEQKGQANVLRCIKHF